jgi:uncharacterized membrane protein YuzA (DUF378 family)
MSIVTTPDKKITASNRRMNNYLYLVSISMILVGGLNWGVVGAFGWNGVQWAFGTSISRIIFILVGISALLLIGQRDVYLPFLGSTVLPCSAIPVSVPDRADKEVIIRGLQPGAKILYWASEPETAGLASINTWQQAYLGFMNAGVTVVDRRGIATLRIRSPQPYTVPIHGRIERHVHWRQCGDGGMLGPVNNQLVNHRVEP